MKLNRLISFMELPQQRGLERQYTRLLVSAVREWGIESAQAVRDALATFNDSWIDDLDSRIAALWEQKERDITEGRIARPRPARTTARTPGQSRLDDIVQESTKKTDDWWASSVKRLTGADDSIIREKMGKRTVNKAINARMNENLKLIKDIGVKTRAQIKAEIKAGIKNKLTNEEIAKNIQQRFDVSEARAKVIATDQVQKHNSSIAQARMREAGALFYIWTSQGDSRVRQSHRIFNGQKYRWDKPTSEGYPGEPILCRCFAVNVLPDELYGLEVKAKYLELIGERLKEFRKAIPDAA